MRRGVMVLVAIASVMLCQSATAQGPAKSKSLRGLTGLHVIVEDLNEALERDGLFASRIQPALDKRSFLNSKQAAKRIPASYR